MTDVTAGNGIARTATGEIAEPGSQQQQQAQTTETGKSETKPETTKPTQTAEGQGDEGKSLLNKEVVKEDGKPEAATGAPEKYEPYTLPEGLELDEGNVTEFNTIAKTLNLSQAQAQQLVDFHVKSMQAAQDAPAQLWKDTQAEWTKTVVNDPNLGTGKDLKPEVVARVGKLIDSLGELAAPFRKAMDYTGIGNHPDFVRAFDALAQRMTEGTHVTGGGPSPHGQTKPGTSVKPSPAQAMYPNLPSAG